MGETVMEDIIRRYIEHCIWGQVTARPLLDALSLAFYIFQLIHWFP